MESQERDVVRTDRHGDITGRWSVEVDEILITSEERNHVGIGVCYLSGRKTIVEFTDDGCEVICSYDEFDNNLWELALKHSGR